MNSREKVLYNLFPDFKEILDQREYHRTEFFINNNKIKERIKQFSEKLTEMEIVQEGDVIKGFNFRNNRFFINYIDIQVTKVNNKFISFITTDLGNNICVFSGRKYHSHSYKNKGRINKIDFYTSLLYREDYKHILRDFFIDQLI